MELTTDSYGHGHLSLFGCFGLLDQLDSKHAGDILLLNFHNYLPVDTESRPNGLSLQELYPVAVLTFL